MLLTLHAHAVLLHGMCMDCAENAQSWLECFIYGRTAISDGVLTKICIFQGFVVFYRVVLREENSEKGKQHV